MNIFVSATAQVQISIADKNDNSPYFTQSSWSAQVPEQRPDDVGRIVTVTALDRDEGMVHKTKVGTKYTDLSLQQKTLAKRLLTLYKPSI